MVVYPLHDFLKPIQVMDPVEVGDVETKNSVNSLQMANAAAASLQNAFLQSARPLPFSINNILHQVRKIFYFVIRLRQMDNVCNFLCNGLVYNLY